MSAGQGSYDAVMKAQLWTDRGAYEDLSYMPVFRGSGIFYVVVDETITTRVAFLHYWREKNNIAELGLLITLRDSKGGKVARRYLKISEMAYDFDVRDFIAPQTRFIGSIELEVFSSEDLKFQFPGFTVFYQTARGVSYVHTNQRIYNSAEDRARGENLNPWQGGFDIDTARHDPFLFLVNGPVAVENAQAELVVTNAAGAELRRTLMLGSVPAYGTQDLRLRKIDGLAKFLGDRPGMCKINLPFSDIHLRIAVGNALPDQSWLSITHSYFDAVGHDEYYDSSTLPADTHPAFVPFALIEGIDLDLVLYPILARCDLQLALQCFDNHGHSRAAIDLGSYRSPEDGIRRLDIRSLLAQHKIAADAGLYVLQITARNNKIPTRITYGLNYRIGQKLGTNISSSAYMAKSWGARGRSWRWGPIATQHGSQNKVAVVGFRKEKTFDGTVDFSVLLYNHGGLVAQQDFVMAANGCTIVEAEAMLAAAGYVPADGEILWYVVQSKSASLDAAQICLSADGFIGGDHCF
jgi:hypothetical protein